MGTTKFILAKTSTLG